MCVGGMGTYVYEEPYIANLFGGMLIPSPKCVAVVINSQKILQVRTGAHRVDNCWVHKGTVGVKELKYKFLKSRDYFWNEFSTNHHSLNSTSWHVNWGCRVK